MRRLFPAALFLAGCAPATPGATASQMGGIAVSTSTPVAIVHAEIWTGNGKRIHDASLLMQGGRLAAVGGPETPLPAAVAVIDAKGRNVTPGLIDVHSHIGVYPSPAIEATADGNELTDPVTAQVSSEYSIWPQDPNILRVMMGGTTTSLVLPGSGNLIGGRGIAIHDRPGRTVKELRIAGAPSVLKMACGENPKRVYGERKQAPSTRMGNFAGYRAAFEQATEYRRKWEEWKKKGAGDPPARDWKLETLSEVLEGKVLVENHCYRSEEMSEMIDLGEEFGFKIRAFHHALEAYKIRELLASKGVGVATWADWWGFKLEAYDGIPQNAALLAEAGVKVAIHSDDPTVAQRLNQEAAKALAYGKRAGINLSEDDALTWITSNPAWEMGAQESIGSLEKGKIADVVVWSGDPFSVYAHPDLVFVEGQLLYDRTNAPLGPRTDFELGITR